MAKLPNCLPFQVYICCVPTTFVNWRTHGVNLIEKFCLMIRQKKKDLRKVVGKCFASFHHIISSFLRQWSVRTLDRPLRELTTVGSISRTGWPGFTLDIQFSNCPCSHIVRNIYITPLVFILACRTQRCSITLVISLLVLLRITKLTIKPIKL